MSIWMMVRHRDGEVTGNNVTADWRGRDNALTGVCTAKEPWRRNWTHVIRLEADSYDDAQAKAVVAFGAHDAREAVQS